VPTVVREPAERFLGNKFKSGDFEQVKDILDVWFDSGSTHVFHARGQSRAEVPADLYLEGSTSIAAGSILAAGELRHARSRASTTRC